MLEKLLLGPRKNEQPKAGTEIVEEHAGLGNGLGEDVEADEEREEDGHLPEGDQDVGRVPLVLLHHRRLDPPQKSRNWDNIVWLIMGETAQM